MMKIKELHEARKELEEQLYTSVAAFEKKTGLTVEGIHVERYSILSIVPFPERDRDTVLSSVVADIRL